MKDYLVYCFKKYWKFFCGFFIIKLIGIATSYSTPILLATKASPPYVLQNFIDLCFWLIGIGILDLLTSYVTRKYFDKFFNVLPWKLKREYFKKLVCMPISKVNVGEVQSKVDGVCYRTGGLVTHGLFELISILVGFSIFFTAAFRQSSILGFACLGVCIVFIPISLAFSKRLQPLKRDVSEKMSKCNADFVDIMTNLKTVKKLNIFTFADNKLALRTDSLDCAMKAENSFNASRWLILDGITTTVMLLAISVSLVQAINGAEDSLAYVIFYITSYKTLQSNLKSTSSSAENYMSFKTYFDQLEELISSSRDESEQPTVNGWNTFTVRDLRFRYPEESQVIYIPEFSITRGQNVCISGESGDGKTTFLNLLTGELKPLTGKFFVDDVEVNCLPGNVAFISQEVELFNVTLRENICLGNKHISQEEINRLIKEVNLHKWMTKRKYGLETVVGEKGFRISTGQKQRINIIRGMLMQKEIFILDEPTSNLDSKTEKKVVEMLQNLNDKTLIVVSHREEIEKICDIKYEFKNGELKRVY